MSGSVVVIPVGRLSKKAGLTGGACGWPIVRPRSRLPDPFHCDSGLDCGPFCQSGHRSTETDYPAPILSLLARPAGFGKHFSEMRLEHRVSSGNRPLVIQRCRLAAAGLLWLPWNGTRRRVSGRRYKAPNAALQMKQSTIEACVGNTPLVRLQRLPGETSNTLLVKLEGNNPAGSVKDRPALNMIRAAERRGEIRPGDTLIEATSGNTGIALAMAAAIRGFHLVLIMPEHMSLERRGVMRAYGADIVLTPREGSMEAAIDLARQMEQQGRGRVLDQFANPDNPSAHYQTTGPEIWRDTQGRITHFVSAMGTTGTIMGTSRFLKEQNQAIQIVGVQPEEGSSIPGIRRWPEAYLPKIFDPRRVDRVMDVTQTAAEAAARDLAASEGIFAGVSSGGAVAAALRLSCEVEDAVIVSIACDRGDRYLSTGLFPAD